MLWVNGTNDPHYHLPIFQKSAQAHGGTSTLVIRNRMDHGHGSGWAPPEIYAFAKASVGRGEPFVEVGVPTQRDHVASVQYHDEERPGVASAALLGTSDGGPWAKRQWHTLPAQVDAAERTIRAEIPRATTAFFFNVTDERDLMVSSPFVELTSE